MINEKEILDALKLLQSVCNENNAQCENCVLRNGSDECGVLCDSTEEGYYNLREWRLKDIENPRLILN
jgi:hypothetical protein